MKTLSFLFILILSTSVAAKPKHFEVWFLSTPASAWLDQLLPKTTFSAKTARVQCQQMGEYCFDPQVGLYKKGEEEKILDATAYDKIEKKEKYNFIDTPSSLDREMINCDKASFFDIFCGKTQKRVKAGLMDLEVWVDISSTMKQVDFQGYKKQCKRESFLKKLNQTCPLNRKMKVSYFDEVRKEAGMLDRVCLNGGLNDMKKLMRELRASKSKNVIIITDIFEASELFINEIELAGGIVKGVDSPMYASNLDGELQRVRKFCK